MSIQERWHTPYTSYIGSLPHFQDCFQRDGIFAYNIVFFSFPTWPTTLTCTYLFLLQHYYYSGKAKSCKDVTKRPSFWENLLARTWELKEKQQITPNFFCFQKCGNESLTDPVSPFEPSLECIKLVVTMSISLTTKVKQVSDYIGISVKSRFISDRSFV